MKATYVLDTSVILYNPQVLNAFEHNEVVIPMTVIEELDKFKSNRRASGFNAREALRLLSELEQEGSLAEGVKLKNASKPYKCGILRVDTCEGCLSEGFDMKVSENIILNLARMLMREKKRSVILMTLNRTLRLKANVLGIPVDNFEYVQAYLDNQRDAPLDSRLKVLLRHKPH